MVTQDKAMLRGIVQKVLPKLRGKARRREAARRLLNGGLPGRCGGVRGMGGVLPGRGRRGAMGGLTGAGRSRVPMPDFAALALDEPIRLEAPAFVRDFMQTLPGKGEPGWPQRTVIVSTFSEGYGSSGVVLALEGSPCRFAALLLASDPATMRGIVWLPQSGKYVAAQPGAGRPGERWQMLAAFLTEVLPE